MRKLEEFFGLTFDDKDLLETALTHSSYANEHNTESNERLEYMGDAVLDLLMGEYLYKKFPKRQEGALTKMRAKNVCESALVEYAKRCDLKDYLLLGKGEEMSGGRNRSALQADAFEALLGAIYLDKGLEEVRKVFDKVVVPTVESDKVDNFVRCFLAQSMPVRCRSRYRSLPRSVARKAMSTRSASSSIAATRQSCYILTR